MNSKVIVCILLVQVLVIYRSQSCTSIVTLNNSEEEKLCIVGYVSSSFCGEVGSMYGCDYYQYKSKILYTSINNGSECMQKCCPSGYSTFSVANLNGCHDKLQQKNQAYSNNIKVRVGLAIGFSILGVILIIVLIVCLCRRHRRKKEQQAAKNAYQAGSAQTINYSGAVQQPNTNQMPA